MPRRASSSPLFPYTTLFRSHSGPHGYIQDKSRYLSRLKRIEGQARDPLEPAEVADRKSTRLNSSHVSISYAVFCLKKKNRKNTNRHATERASHIQIQSGSDQ